ncbi:MAG: hypothetical protein MZV70_48655 [Desulfobacterales bacterium]|nr:hypothetical protein [Desulfobacterales bacterium]
MTSYELFISLRYLRAKRKQVFVSIITFISIAGMLSRRCRPDHRTRRHERLRDRPAQQDPGDQFPHHRDAIRRCDAGSISGDARIRPRLPGVVAATPFIYSQAMLKNGSSVTGVVLRGLSAEDALKVITLGKIQEGKIDDLDEGKAKSPI